MENLDDINLLKAKHQELGRLPKKSDFSEVEVAQIKAKLGPWNRALEKAELKEISTHFIQKKEKQRQKKIQKKLSR